MDYNEYRALWESAKEDTPNYPVHIDIEIASFCNLKCSFCPHSEPTHDFKKLHMDFDLFKDIIDQIEGYVPSIKLNLRGEPTLYPHFKEALLYIDDKFVDVRLNTNGNFDSSLIKFMEDSLYKAPNISFSVDALSPAVHGTIHKNSNFILVMNNLSKFYEYAPDQLTISYVVTKENKHELKKFKKVTPILYPQAKLFIRNAFERTQTTNGINQKISGRKNCFMPNRRLAIASNGDVYPCCVQWKKPFLIIENIKNLSIFKIWHSKKMMHLRRTLSNIEADQDVKRLPIPCQNCMSSESYILE